MPNKVKVSALRAGNRFLWGKDIAHVIDLCEIPREMTLPESMEPLISIEVSVPSLSWVGAVRVRSSVEVELVSIGNGDER